MPNTIAIWLKILITFFSLKTSITIAFPITIPDTAVAWSILNIKKSSVEVEKMHPKEDIIKIARHAKRTGRLPYLSDKGPNTICSDADATIYNETDSCMIEKLVS
tara:strand:- start:2924 stop:3238 length:315 start_codon:yes stop_codon:yes gene_type:complete